MVANMQCMVVCAPRVSEKLWAKQNNSRYSDVVVIVSKAVK